MVTRNTSWSDTVEMPWPRRTLIAYSRLLHDVNKWFRWSIALSRSLSVMPRTLALLTHSMFGHGSGGWVNHWPQNEPLTNSDAAFQSRDSKFLVQNRTVFQFIQVSGTRKNSYENLWHMDKFLIPRFSYEFPVQETWTICHWL